jgi:hypothetical protein
MQTELRSRALKALRQWFMLSSGIGRWVSGTLIIRQQSQSDSQLIDSTDS